MGLRPDRAVVYRVKCEDTALWLQNDAGRLVPVSADDYIDLLEKAICGADNVGRKHLDDLQKSLLTRIGEPVL